MSSMNEVERTCGVCHCWLMAIEGMVRHVGRDRRRAAASGMPSTSGLPLGIVGARQVSIQRALSSFRNLPPDFALPSQPKTTAKLFRVGPDRISFFENEAPFPLITRSLRHR